MVKKIQDLYLEARRAFMMQEDAQSAGLLARSLLCHLTGKSNEQIIIDRDMYVGQQTCDEMSALVERVLNGEPLAYVLGQWEFYGMPICVTKDVLIPRDDTCAVTELAIKYALFLGENPRILDLCTGSGCIGIAIASRVTDAKVTCADISKDALAVAKKNVTLNKMGGRIHCIQADALGQPAPFLGKFDMIVSNPPYVTAEEMQQLPDGVKNYEPHLALYGGNDGLDFYRNIAKSYSAVLKPDGYLCFEFGMGQGNDICQILEDNNFTVLERVKDYNDRERAVIARINRKD